MKMSSKWMNMRSRQIVIEGLVSSDWLRDVRKTQKKATKAETSSLSSAAYHSSRSIVLFPLQMGFYHPQLSFAVVQFDTL